MGCHRTIIIIIIATERCVRQAGFPELFARRAVRLINAGVLFFHAMRAAQNDDWLITRCDSGKQKGRAAPAWHKTR